MVAEIKAKGAKSRRNSGQTLRLRRRHWVLSGLKADRKNVGKTPDTITNNHVKFM